MVTEISPQERARACKGDKRASGENDAHLQPPSARLQADARGRAYVRPHVVRSRSMSERARAHHHERGRCVSADDNQQRRRQQATSTTASIADYDEQRRPRRAAADFYSVATSNKKH